MAEIVPVLILAVSALALGIAMSRLVQGQRGEIGLSKALGYTDGQILAQYLGFSLIVGVIGSLVGISSGRPWLRHHDADVHRLPQSAAARDVHLPGRSPAALVAISVARLPAGRPRAGVARRACSRLGPCTRDPTSQTKGGRAARGAAIGWAMPNSIVFRCRCATSSARAVAASTRSSAPSSLLS